MNDSVGNAKLIIGYNLISNSLKHISEVERGINCKCLCPECKKPLIAHQGFIRTPHFKHQSKSLCKGGKETALHKYGKQILLENTRFHFPTIGFIEYTPIKKEVAFEGIIPDVTAKYFSEDGKEHYLFFEIVVTNPVSNEKRNFYKLGKFKSVSIVINHLIDSTNQNIIDCILLESPKKEKIYWEEEIVLESLPMSTKSNVFKIKGPEKSTIDLVVLGSILAVFVGIVYFILNKKPPKKKRNSLK